MSPAASWEYIVPQAWLNAFLQTWIDDVGTQTEDIVSIEPTPAVASE